ncbi:hypothetical protein [Pseudarthrobacter sp. GA104]|uniref:hypothetical protein n=1 Tax=Pseudarthrobacter sp. GA104 TaxID=2676311 RepID=UPI0012F89A61|nr:hypothetical protein [Pseudarthrobacter sp. GA104]MUU69695.1 hypothetical protein [Pseudarthrobacter sp. GA104]
MEEDAAVQGHRTYTGTTPEGEAAVGRIAIWAASVEDNLVELCARLINSDNREAGYAVTVNMSASSVIQLARKLVTDSNKVSEKDKTEVLAMLTEAKAALEQRNKILHGRVGELMFEGKTTFFHRRRKGPVPVGQNPGWHSTSLGLEELDKIGARLFDVSEDLWGYVYLPPD